MYDASEMLFVRSCQQQFFYMKLGKPVLRRLPFSCAYCGGER